MNKNLYFKATPKYREYIILDSIDKNKNITQRELSSEAGITVSMVNGLINSYEKKGLIRKKYLSSKTVEYFLTKKGLEKKKVLNIGYLSSSLSVYNQAKENIMIFLNNIVDKGFNNILLYGAGEVAEILLQTLQLNKDIPVNVKAIIDDNNIKQGNYLVNVIVIGLSEIEKIKHDGILISSYTNRNKILNNLLKINYDTKRIFEFFKK
jgi:DNA-binding MarR family transcriptional regulator